MYSAIGDLQRNVYEYVFKMIIKEYKNVKAKYEETWRKNKEQIKL